MLVEVIGTPAMLEQTAKKCVELAKACLNRGCGVPLTNDAL